MGKKRRRETPAKAPRRGKKPAPLKERPEKEGEQGFRFDPYWDDEFSAYFDPTLRTCCQLRY